MSRNRESIAIVVVVPGVAAMPLTMLVVKMQFVIGGFKVPRHSGGDVEARYLMAR